MTLPGVLTISASYDQTIDSTNAAEVYAEYERITAMLDRHDTREAQWVGIASSLPTTTASAA